MGLIPRSPPVKPVSFDSSTYPGRLYVARRIYSNIDDPSDGFLRSCVRMLLTYPPLQSMDIIERMGEPALVEAPRGD